MPVHLGKLSNPNPCGRAQLTKTNGGPVTRMIVPHHVPNLRVEVLQLITRLWLVVVPIVATIISWPPVVTPIPLLASTSISRLVLVAPIPLLMPVTPPTSPVPISPLLLVWLLVLLLRGRRCMMRSRRLRWRWMSPVWVSLPLVWEIDAIRTLPVGEARQECCKARLWEIHWCLRGCPSKVIRFQTS